MTGKDENVYYGTVKLTSYVLISVVSKRGSESLASRSREVSEMGEFIKLNSSRLQTFLESRQQLETTY